MTALHFYLNSLNINGSSIHADLMTGEVTIGSGGAKAQLYVPISLVKSIFKFQTDSIDVCNNVLSDVKYKVVDPENDWIYSPADAYMDNADSIAFQVDNETNLVQHDWMRYLSVVLFGTHLGVDLFTNEEEIRSNLVTDSLNSLKERFRALAALGEQTDEQIFDETTFEVIPNSSQQLLQQIISNDSSRLSQLGTPDENGYFPT